MIGIESPVMDELAEGALVRRSTRQQVSFLCRVFSRIFIFYNACDIVRGGVFLLRPNWCLFLDFTRFFVRDFTFQLQTLTNQHPGAFFKPLRFPNFHR